MSVLSDEREGIKEALAATYPVTTFVPDSIVPPAAFIAAGDPYLEKRAADPFGTLTASFEVWIVQNKGTNKTVTDVLDDEIERAAEALTAAGFTVREVSEPFQYQVQGGNYLTVIIHVQTGVTLNT